MQVFSVQQGASGWSVRHDQVPLAEGLSLGQAIKLARQAGRRHNEEFGQAVTVELAIPEKGLLLAQYSSKDIDTAAAA